MQNLVKAKLPTPREDGKPGANVIRKHRFYLEDDGNLTPSEAAKNKKSVTSKPIYILASSREDAIKKLICFMKDDRRLIGPLECSDFKKKRHRRVEELAKEESTKEKHRVDYEKDVIERKSVSPLSIPSHTLVISDSWRLALQGIFLEMIRTFWLLSRRNQIKEVTIDNNVEEMANAHPVKEFGFLLTSASSAIDVVLSRQTIPVIDDIFTTLTYLTPDRKRRVDYHLILNKRGVRAMERFVDHFSRPSDIKESIFDSLNLRLVVSSSRKFFIEPYLRLKAISYLS